MDLSELQQRRDTWVSYNFPGQDMPHSLLGAVEELGELSHHYLKMKQGIRGTDVMHRDEMADAVADCVIYLAGVASYLGLDYGQLVTETWKRVEMRDWVKYPKTGMPAEERV